MLVTFLNAQIFYKKLEYILFLHLFFSFETKYLLYFSWRRICLIINAILENKKLYIIVGTLRIVYAFVYNYNIKATSYFYYTIIIFNKKLIIYKSFV